MKEELWLMQKYDNGDFFIYGWTPILAAKGYKVLTTEQAKPYQDLMAKGKGQNNVEFLEDTELFDIAKETAQKSGFVRDEMLRKEALAREGITDENDDEETVDLVGKVAGTGEDTTHNLDQVRDISTSQEDVQAAEMKHIKSLQHKTSLENHMLTKYQCEIPMGKLSMMKAMANSMINDLAKENRLYFVDGGVAVK
jgi:hypothetical protein